jgi:hypothetical protein
MLMRKMTQHSVVSAGLLLVSAAMTLTMMAAALDVVIVIVEVIVMTSLLAHVGMMDVEATVVLSLAAV